MNENKKYRLLKDLPITLAGTIFIQKESNSSVYKPENGGWLEEVPEELVTGCPEWFEVLAPPPVKEKEFIEITYRRISGKKISDENTFMFIPAEIFEETKEAISDVFIKHYPTPQPTAADTGKEWEILSFKNNKNQNIVRCSEIKYMPEMYSIHSVRRLSDNCVFTANEINNGKTIEKFFIGWNGMEIHYTDGSASLLLEETKLPSKEQSKPVTDNDDVAVFSVSDVVRMFKNGLIHIGQLREKATEKLKQ